MAILSKYFINLLFLLYVKFMLFYHYLISISDNIIVHIIQSIFKLVTLKNLYTVVYLNFNRNFEKKQPQLNLNAGLQIDHHHLFIKIVLLLSSCF